MQKKLLAASLLLFLGAGCSGAATSTLPSTTANDTGTEGTAAEEAADGVTANVTTNENTVAVGLDIATPTQLFTVTASSFAFSPSTMTVKKGDTVVITFKNSENIHNFVLEEFGLDSGPIDAGDKTTFTFVADKVGSFEYYCSIGQHRAMGMKGTLTVTE